MLRIGVVAYSLALDKGTAKECMYRPYLRYKLYEYAKTRPLGENANGRYLVEYDGELLFNG